MPITSGESILNGKYRIIKLIGEGGMACVWLAEEMTFGNRLVAIKQPLPGLLPGKQEELQFRYQNEVYLCAALEKAHVPHVVRSLTAEPYENSLLLVLEYMPGGDLAHILQAYPNGLPLRQALEITRDVLAAVSGVHALTLGIVHRDIKPSNILFDSKGLAYLGDFGAAQIAGLSHRSHLQGGSHPGTPFYMAPEQGSSVTYLTPAADIYALGCVLFEILTGRNYKRYRPGTPVSGLNPSLPKRLDEVLAKALAEDPFDRYQSADEMTEALSKGQNVVTLETSRQIVVKEEHNIPARKAVPTPTKPQVSQGADPLVLTLAPGITLALVRIPAGEFGMGSSDKGSNAQRNEKPQHKVYLDEYLMGMHEVTMSQFRAFIQATGFRTDSKSFPMGKDDHPVTMVSWDDAIAFCRWASQVTGRDVHLPTEAQWEKAARGTEERIYPWGNIVDRVNRCNCDNNVGDTTPVSELSPSGDSPYGCMDMSGNVWEWVNDWYQCDYYSVSSGSNPPGPATGKYRVLHGGGWGSNWGYVRASNRYHYTPDVRKNDVGFRCAVSPGT